MPLSATGLGAAETQRCDWFITWSSLAYGLQCTQSSILNDIQMWNVWHSTQPHLGIVGQQAPDWSVSECRRLPDGTTTLNVDNFRGKVLYLYFFQSWCPGCHSRGFPTLQKLQQQFANDDNVAFVVVQTTFEGHAQNGADKLLPTNCCRQRSVLV